LGWSSRGSTNGPERRLAPSVEPSPHPRRPNRWRTSWASSRKASTSAEAPASASPTRPGSSSRRERARPILPALPGGAHHPVVLRVGSLLDSRLRDLLHADGGLARARNARGGG